MKKIIIKEWETGDTWESMEVDDLRPNIPSEFGSSQAFYVESMPEDYEKKLCGKIYKDGNAWCAVLNDFKNLQESPAWFGQTASSAHQYLIKDMRQPKNKKKKGFPFLFENFLIVEKTGEKHWCADVGCIL